MKILAVILLLLVARFAILGVLRYAVPALRRGIHAATRNDFAWLGTWVAIIATVGYALSLAHTTGHLG